MMSLTISLERPFSAESCARPVTSSRFMSHAPPSFISPQATKKVGSTHFQGAQRRRASDPLSFLVVLPSLGPSSRGELRFVEANDSRPVRTRRVVEGLTNDEIGQVLGISEETVKKHVSGSAAQVRRGEPSRASCEGDRVEDRRPTWPQVARDDSPTDPEGSGF